MFIYLIYFSFFFFFNDTATTEIYTLSLHDALPISPPRARARPRAVPRAGRAPLARRPYDPPAPARPTRGRAPPPRTRPRPQCAPAPPAGRVLLPGPAAAPQWRAAGRHCAAARRRAPGHPP